MRTHLGGPSVSHPWRVWRALAPARAAARAALKRANRALPVADAEPGPEVSPMYTACYEAHLRMAQMLAAFAEFRGDDRQAPY